MATQGTLESVATLMANLLQPLEEELTPGRVRVLFAELGMEFPPELQTKTAFINALGQTVSQINKLPGIISTLITAISNDNFSVITSTGLELFNTVKTTIQNIHTVSDELKNIGGTLPGVSAPDVTAFANELPKKIIDYLIIRNLEGTPGLAEAFEFIDAVERKDIVNGTFSYTTRKLKTGQLSNFISKPGPHLDALYDWGKPSFDGVKLLQIIEQLLLKANLPAIFDPASDPPTLDLVYLEASPRTDIDPKGLQIKFLNKIILNSQEFSRDDWKIKFDFGVDIGPGFLLIIQPDGKLTFVPPKGELTGKASIEWTAGDTNGDPYLILGQPGASRLEAKQLLVKSGLDISWNSSSRQATGVLKIEGGIKGGKFIVDFSKGDGFLTKILSNINLESDFDIGFGYSSRDGLFFYGSGALIIQLPLHLALGPIEINALSISVGINSDKVPIELGVNFKANMGPLTIVVEQIGLKADLSFPSNQNGNLGPVDLAFGFKPPNGLGLSINAGAVIGGGYLFFDFENEEYAGALELTIVNFISAKAIGLITTRMPDGSKGFSLLVIITAEFFPPFQLGYGFTLNAVGGLIGLNRTVLLDPLRNGVRTGAVNSIMFPQNVIANAPRIISDLKAIFPPLEGRFLIGPMGKLGWGTPSLITLSLGLIIEIPGNIAILGVLRIALPEESIALINIQVNFVGTLDFDKKMLTFDASLYDSRILFMTLEGDMAVRLKWGDEPDFILTVGGFHPSYTPPPLALPALKRITISILNTDLARIRVECYQAVTSNTAQFGAKAEAFFGFSSLSVEGYLSFDALFQFSPFTFIIEYSSSFSLKAFGIGVCSVRLRGSLQGPTPWRAKGSGGISFFFFDIDVDFDKTWGESKDTSLPPIEILPRLLDELKKRTQWHAYTPSGNQLQVSLRKLNETTDTLVLHPAGSLVVQQKLMPLDLDIDKIGNQKTSDIKRAAISNANSAGNNLTVLPLNDFFARAQYQDMSDADKLSKPSFEKLHGGVTITMGSTNADTSTMTRKIVQYEEIIIDKEPQKPLPKGKFLTQVGELFFHFLRGSSVTKSTYSKAAKDKLQPFAGKIKVHEDSYAVAFTENNNAVHADAIFSSEAMATDYMKQKAATDPSVREKIHVISAHELN